jgi:hypothetical protein
MPTRGLLCEAIRARSLLAFEYEGLARVVAPYCHGTNRRGVEVLRAVQLRGATRSGGLGFGKLWIASKMVHVRVLEETFSRDDPDYNPDDSAMLRIHCRV